MSFQVRDNPAHDRYEMDVDGGTAVANYRADDKVVTVFHTEVPAALRETIPPTTSTTTTSTTIAGPTTTAAPTTTVLEPVEIIQLFYVQGTRIRAVSITETKPIGPNETVGPQRKLFDLVQRQAMLSGEARLASVLSVGAVLTAELKRGNIIVDFFTVKCSERTNEMLDRIGAVILCACFALLAWRTTIGGLSNRVTPLKIV